MKAPTVKARPPSDFEYSGEIYKDLPTSRYSTVVVDPPWKYGDSLPGDTRGASKQYPTLTPWEIAQLPVPLIAEDNAHLYVWATNSFMSEAYDLVEHWGFKPITIITWVKTKKGHYDAESTDDLAFGMGHYWRNATEQAIFAKRGKLPALSRSTRNVIFAPLRAHSEKPPEFYRAVREVSPGPRIDLFARPRHEGFDAWGNDVQE